MNARLFLKASRIGFGCASLGSRVGPQKGLASLGQAFDAGVNWFDLAPAYGDGTAETVFAEFVRGRRDRIHICTKVGIQASTPGVMSRSLRPLVQVVTAAIPASRAIFARGRSAPSRVRLTPRLIRESLDTSLRRMRTDYVDVYALHDPDPTLLDDDLRRALEDIVAAGKVRSAGIAGSIEAAALAWRNEYPVGHVQIAAPPFAGATVDLAKSLPQDANFFLVTHSIYGHTDPLRVLLARTGSRKDLAATLSAYGYAMPIDQAVRALLLDDALLSNPNGVVLLSMFSPAHIAANMARLRSAASTQAKELIAQLASRRRQAGELSSPAGNSAQAGDIQRQPGEAGVQ